MPTKSKNEQLDALKDDVPIDALSKLLPGTYRFKHITNIEHNAIRYFAPALSESDTYELIFRKPMDSSNPQTKEFQTAYKLHRQIAVTEVVHALMSGTTAAALIPCADRLPATGFTISRDTDEGESVSITFNLQPEATDASEEE